MERKSCSSGSGVAWGSLGGVQVKLFGEEDGGHCFPVRFYFLGWSKESASQIWLLLC
jgi:hypothetical protein